MKIEQKHIYAVAAVGTAALITLDSIRIIRKGRQDRKEIRANSAKEIAAIRAASMLIRGKIHAGEYDGCSFAQLDDDLHFYTIAFLEEK